MVKLLVFLSTLPFSVSLNERERERGGVGGDRQTNRQPDRQTDRQRQRQRDREGVVYVYAERMLKL